MAAGTRDFRVEESLLILLPRLPTLSSLLLYILCTRTLQALNSKPRVSKNPEVALTKISKGIPGHLNRETPPGKTT